MRVNLNYLDKNEGLWYGEKLVKLSKRSKYSKDYKIWRG